MEDRWLSVDEIAEYLGVTRETIYTWLSKKGLPGYRVGRLWKFKKDAVDTWVESRDSRDVNEIERRTRGAPEMDDNNGKKRRRRR